MDTLDLTRAMETMQQGNYTLVLCRGEMVYTSTERGVAPMLRLLGQGTDLRGFSAADKAVGKGAAVLFALAGVRAVYTPVLSRPAAETLDRAKVAYTCDVLTEGIQNRTGTGPCPVEHALRDVDDLQTALRAIRETVQALQKKASTPASLESV